MEKWKQEEQLTSKRMNQMIDEIGEAIQNVTQDVRLASLEQRALALESDVRSKVSGADVDGKIGVERAKIDRELNKKVSSVDLAGKLGDLKSELTATISSKPELNLIEQKINDAVRSKVDEGLVDRKITETRETLDALIDAKASSEQLSQSIDGIRREVSTTLAQKIGLTELNQVSRNIQETFNSQLAGKVGSGEVDAAIQAERKKIDKELSKKITPSDVDKKISSALQNHSGGVNQEQVEQVVNNALVQVNEKIGKKAEKTDVSNQIEQVKTELSSQIGEKITEQKAQQLILHALAGHTGTPHGETVGRMIESAIGVERQRVDAALQDKANTSDVEQVRSEIVGKIDEKSAKALIKAERKLIDKELEKKVESVVLESKVSELNTAINGKADATAIDSAVNAERKKIDKEIAKKVNEAKVVELIGASELKLNTSIQQAVGDRITSREADSRIEKVRESLHNELVGIKSGNFARTSDVDELLERLKDHDLSGSLSESGVFDFKVIEDFDKIAELNVIYERVKYAPDLAHLYDEALNKFDSSRHAEINGWMQKFSIIANLQRIALKLRPIRSLLKLILEDNQLERFLCFRLNELTSTGRVGETCAVNVVELVANMDKFSTPRLSNWTPADWGKTTKRYFYMHLILIHEELYKKQGEWAVELIDVFDNEVGRVNIDPDVRALREDWLNRLEYDLHLLMSLAVRTRVESFFKRRPIARVLPIWYGRINSERRFKLVSDVIFVNRAPSGDELKRLGLADEATIWFFEVVGTAGSYDIGTDKGESLEARNLSGRTEKRQLSVDDLYNFEMRPQHLCIGTPTISFNRTGEGYCYIKCKVFSLKPH